MPRGGVFVSGERWKSDSISKSLLLCVLPNVTHGLGFYRTLLAMDTAQTQKTRPVTMLCPWVRRAWQERVSVRFGNVKGEQMLSKMRNLPRSLQKYLLPQAYML